MGVEGAFLIFGGIIFIGYFGELLSKKFAIPSALLLLLIGYLLRLSGSVESETLAPIQDIFGTLALIILLFDGSLSLKLEEVIFKSGRVVFNSIIITVLAIVGCALLFLVIGFNPVIGAIIGAIAGGIGSATTISFLKVLDVPSQVKNFLVLESSITDVFSIVLTIVFAQALLSGALDVQTLGQAVLGRFSIGVLIGIVVGLASIITLTKIKNGYNYMITFGIILTLYAITDIFSGSGAIAVLVFGLMLGNESAIRHILRMDSSEEKPVIKNFQEEISFFVRTFFFVFLGIIVELGSITNFIIALVLMILLYGIRYVSILVSTKGDKQLTSFFKLLVAINPRGLTTAVLATYPVILIQGEIAKGNTSLTGALLQVENLPEIAFYIIILSIVATSVLVPMIMHNGKTKKGKKSKKKQKKLQEKNIPI